MPFPVELISALVSTLKTAASLVLEVVSWARKWKKERRAETRAADRGVLVSRFLQTFESYEVPRPLIPRFAGVEDKLSIQDASTDDALANALTDEIVQIVAARFAIQASWIYGVETQPYAVGYSYRNPARTLERLVEMVSRAPVLWDELVFVANGKVPEVGSQCGDLRLVVLYRAQIGVVEGKDVERVEVFDADIPWSHDPARLHAKEITLLAMSLGVHVRGTTQPPKRFNQFLRGELFAHQLVTMGASWHPDDYVVLREVSLVAKERIEALEVRKYVSPHLLAKADEIRRRLGRDSYKDVLGSA